MTPESLLAHYAVACRASADAYVPILKKYACSAGACAINAAKNGFVTDETHRLRGLACDVADTMVHDQAFVKAFNAELRRIHRECNNILWKAGLP